jgi:hypothetical protein
MIFDPKNELDKKRAIERMKYFLQKGKVFDLTEKKEQRSLKQNRYMHLIFSWYALEYGETTEYVKQEIFKKQVNKDIFLTEYANRQTGEIRTSWKSTKDLNTGQMTTAIDRFRNYASKEAGIYLPEPHEMALLREIEHDIEKHKQFL